MIGTFENSISRNTKARGYDKFLELCLRRQSHPEHVTTVITIFLTLLGLFVFFMMYRNVRVFRFRTNLLNRVHDLNQQSIDEHTNLNNLFWRYHVFNSVSYDQMMYRFWVPLKVERWYKDDAFLR